MSLKTFAIAQAILYLLKDADKKDIPGELVVKIEELSKQNLGGYSEKVQLEIISKILLPVARKLVADNKVSMKEYGELIANEYAWVHDNTEPKKY